MISEQRQRLAVQLVRARALLHASQDPMARLYMEKFVRDLEVRIAACDAPPPDAAGTPTLSGSR